MSKKDLSERDICTQFITPAITAPEKWDLMFGDIYEKLLKDLPSASNAGEFYTPLKNPHNSDTRPGDVGHLLPEYEKLLAQITATRGPLKNQLMEALIR